MTKRFRLLCSLISISQLTIIGCASDPKKDADDAHNAEMKEVRKQDEKGAENRSDNREDSAEAQRKQTTANAKGANPATKDRVEADAKLKEAHDVDRAKATERLDKADAKTNELKSKANRAGAKAPSSVRDALQTVATQRTLVTGEMQKLSSAPIDNYDQVKGSVDTQLDTLDALVKKAANEVDKIK